MKNLMIGATALALVLGQVAYAQPGPHGNQGREDGRGDHRGEMNRGDMNRGDNGRHNGWGRERGNGHRWARGQQMGYNDWNNAERVDYRRYHLRQPPRGYEWRRQNNQFVLAAITTGLIASIIFNSGR